jgi:hypothetical protein
MFGSKLFRKSGVVYKLSARLLGYEFQGYKRKNVDLFAFVKNTHVRRKFKN